jgi:hypothetical protein
VLEAAGLGCGSARGLESVENPVVSLDGRNLYAATFSGLVAFARDRRTGRLLQLPGRFGCIAAGDALDREIDGTTTCARPIPRNWGVEKMAVSPDGRHVYTLAGSLLTVFSRRERP